MVDAVTGQPLLGFVMISVDTQTASRAVCKMAQLGSKDSFAALKLVPQHLHPVHDQVSSHLSQNSLKDSHWSNL